MKNQRATAAILAAAMTVTMLAGCGNNGGDTRDAGNTKESAGSAGNAAEGSESAGSAADTDGGSAVDAGEVQLPLTEEKVTLTVYMPVDPVFVSYSSDYNNSEFFKELERRTNVHIEFVTPAQGEETTAFNLLFTSGTLPDVITGASAYTGGIGAGIDDGYYLDLTDYLDTELAHYNAIRQSDPEILRDTTLDDGRVGAVYQVKATREGAWAGYQIRKDWLEELGLEMPTTYEDLEKVLTAFKEQKGATAPLALAGAGCDYPGVLSAGFNAYPGFIQMDGKVVYSPVTEGWREYLSLMNDWYGKGLINPDFMTAGKYFADMELIVSDQTGVWFSMAKMASTYEAASESIDVVAMPNPVVTEEDETHIRIADSLVTVSNNGCAISTDCENPELAMRWLDYLYTEAGSMLASYGVEGESYTLDADGNAVFTDLIKQNPDGYDANTAMLIYALVPGKIPSYYHFEREYQNMNEEDVESYDIWGQEWEKDDYVIPGAVSMTVEEADEYSALYADILSYMGESALKFITGVLDPNGSDWDDYVAAIEDMNIERCTEIQQAALDRYYVR